MTGLSIIEILDNLCGERVAIVQYLKEEKLCL